MKPKEILLYLEKFDMNFQSLVDEDYVHPISEIKNVIGEFDVIEELDYNIDDKRSFKESIIHFKTFGYYLKQVKSYVWGDYYDTEFFIVEPIDETKIVFGNPKEVVID